METIKGSQTLSELYGEPSPLAIAKVARRVTPLYQQWIEASRFMVLSTTGPEGCDASPRGDNGPVVRIVDSQTIWLPDWRGNNRLDSLKNIVADGRVSLMFMVSGSDNVVRVRGSAVLTADGEITAQFSKGRQRPTTVIVIKVREVYFQCAKALMRSALWNSNDDGGHVPSAGQFLREAKEDFDADGYDATYPTYAKDKMW